jgi:hypothetical protein
LFLFIISIWISKWQFIFLLTEEIYI